MSIRNNKKKFLYFTGGLSIVPPVFFALQTIITGAEVEWRMPSAWEGIIFSIGITAILSYLMLELHEILKRKLPWTKINPTKRIFIQLFSNLIICNVVMICYMIAFQFVLENVLQKDCILQEDMRKYFFNNIMMATVLTILANLILEGSYFLDQWRKSLLETETLKRKNIQSQFESLKNQVNPHFLFNSLNALSSLVHTDPLKAEEFIDEFAKIYRYVLDIKDKVLVPLKEEYHFIKSFIFLQQIRFEKNLQINFNIEEQYLSDFIPPLSLQELIENAIKHNEVSEDNPLQIDIYTENNMLVVSNNIQKRMQTIASTKTGLRNINERYLMLSSSAAQFEENKNHFTVRLPLIKEED